MPMSRLLRFLLVIAAAAVGGGVLYVLLRRRENTTYPSAESLLREPAVDAIVKLTEQGRWHIAWSVPTDSVTIYTGTSPSAIDTTPPTAQVNNAQEITLDDLPPQQPRYFALHFQGGERDGAQIIAAEREIRLEGAVNFRDVGGYRTQSGQAVRWGKVYRAGQLADLTDNDLTTLERLGVALSCDLRLPEEIDEEPDRLPHNVRYEQNSVQSSESRNQQFRRLMFARGRVDHFMTSAYIRVIVENNPHVYARVFELIADESNLPIVVHCTAGKDRTGVAVALLLALLGVPDEVIAADYSLSNRYFDTYVAIGERAIQSVGRLGLTTEAILPLFTANPDTILATLAHVREKYGSVEAYLMQAGGLSEATLARVRANMLR